MKKTLATIAFAALALTGCSAPSGAPVETPTRGTNTPTTSEPAEAPTGALVSNEDAHALLDKTWADLWEAEGAQGQEDLCVGIDLLGSEFLLAAFREGWEQDDTELDGIDLTQEEVEESFIGFIETKCADFEVSAPDGSEGDSDLSAAPRVLAFGETYAWNDRLSVTISEPQAFTPDEWSAGGEAFDKHILFEATIVNGTDEPFDPDMFSASAQSGNVEADSVFDGSAGLDGAPYTTLLPGRETTFKYGFGVMDPKDIVLEVSVDWERPDIIWTF